MKIFNYVPLMKIPLLLFSTILIFSSAVFAQNSIPAPKTFNLSAGITSKDYIPGIIIVKIKSVSTSAIAQNSVQSVADGISLKLKSAKVESILNKFNSPVVNTTNRAVPPTQTTDPSGLDRIYELKFSGNSNIEEVINEILQDPQVEYAEPSYIYHSNYIPNDPSLGSQSYLNLVKAPEAWDIIRNASNVIIGIVDTGSDMDHPDLAANFYINTADPIDGIDNDNDGYIDNYKGWDLVGLSGTNRVPDNNPNVTSDTTMHGVHVSGLASAVSNNGIGIASIAFNAKLLIVKAGADNDGSSIYAGFEGIKYAADHGAKIINCSWGGYSTSSFGLDIVNYAIAKDCLIISSAGNDNRSTPSYPASYPGVISVASVDNLDKKSSFSNYGTRISISAPGSSIYSTLYNNTYGVFSGTSMASPIVASAAALLKAYYPTYSMDQIGTLLVNSADDISAKNTSYPGQLGSGRLNIFRALTQSLTQVITFPALIVKTYGDEDFGPGATINSSLPISYTSSNTAVATIVSGKIHIVGAGTTTITASQNGSGPYTAATPVSRELIVNKAAQTITFTAVPVLIRGGAAATLQATSSSGLPVSLSSSDSFVGSISGNTLLPVRVGKAIITATQAGNANYLPATAVTQELQVTDTDGSVIKVLAALSPNDDGINDFLTIEGIKDYTTNNVTVFTSNGVQVMQISNYNNIDHIFTGRSKNGNTLPQGTYFYLVQFNINGHQQRKTGYLVLKY
jgi:gliding motility-associated-like protein